MSYFAKPKAEPETKGHDVTPLKEFTRTEVNAPVSTLGPGMLIKGDIVCEGTMQIFGRVIGEIHAVKLSIGKGAQVEGRITAQSTIIAGTFKGTINADSVKLESSAVVEGEIFKNALVIDEDAQFEGMTRRLEKPISLPTVAQTVGQTGGDVPNVGFEAAPQTQPAY